ncbi:TIGR02234 family membrane protein [Corynebacterium variabile]|uniref:TIGR02234 family membrane protein n=1 Tax=Corynebacterium variabile TaxID=1727 RepID=UPI002648B23F|nr:TIGR02234 family membrane protein [Corynebacterium variabile]MDN6240150.1 TIGR02234 family membrane protein [Corynebacterium variabile]MDN6476851.1 TIGR02234 family membrane protein [Corynebacterium variabile]MDN6618354.1 TIGR02234 family membrane protein [Corynebacterium variabile]MDN6676186.1 TIGR02234 family membrane protein [Corynebacterium variabile]
MTPAKDTVEDTATKAVKKRLNGRNLALVLTLLSAAGLWGTGQMTWLTASVVDDKTGESTEQIIGRVWDAAGTPLALAMLAAMILSFALAPMARRVLGGISAALAAIAGFAAVMLLGGDPDLDRAQQLLTTGAATQKSTDPVQISDWATVVDASVHTFPVVLALLAAACGVVGGVLLAMKPGEARQGHSRYETPEARREGVVEDLNEEPRSGRVLWDALDAGVDPTDREESDKRPD